MTFLSILFALLIEQLKPLRAENPVYGAIKAYAMRIEGWFNAGHVDHGRLGWLVVIASLVVSAAMVYGSLVVLGRQMGFALSLAGVAGFIVAIGITADSFVVFFERLKDEVRDGRGVRSAVPRAWIRARRTILSADTVSLLAAAVLYFLAVGAVQGFAFTLGLSTIIDLIVVFLFTHPLVALLSRSSTFSSPRVSGLGRLRSGSPTTATPTTRRAGVVRTKES